MMFRRFVLLNEATVVVATVVVFCYYLEGQASAAFSQGGPQTVVGVITPLDEHSMYVLTPQGQVEVRWTTETKVAIKINWRNFQVKERTLSYTIHSSNQRQVIRLPDKQAYARFDRRRFDSTEAGGNVVSPVGMRLQFSPLPDNLPTKDKNWFTGKVDVEQKKLTIGAKTWDIKMVKGQTDVLIFDAWSTADCKPFINNAIVIGRREGDAVIASEVHLEPLGDATASDDPKLPRYLFIGDSISGNYDKGLRAALRGKCNLHHPPTNCGPSGKGANQIVPWLGDYARKGRQWDVISFNFGHWDAGNTKEEYQANLEKVIAELKKTNAKLIWVTTCPVPNGNPTAGDLTPDGKAPGRKAGVMKKYLNPWALEVVKRHPEITICALKDLQAIEGNRDHQETVDLYTRIVRAGMTVLQRENDCCIQGGKAFFFHMHTPLRDGKSEFRLGHPMFGAEDTAHGQSGAWNLPYIWEAGPEFGCSTALVAGYANAMVFTLNDPSATHKNGKPWPRAHLDSPWYLATTGRKDGPAPRLGDRFYALLAFAPDLLAVNRRWSNADLAKGETKFLLLHAGTLYRTWLAGQKPR